MLGSFRSAWQTGGMTPKKVIRANDEENLPNVKQAPWIKISGRTQILLAFTKNLAAALTKDGPQSGKS